ncbi:MAG: chemoreceptor glutamine deamidase CheD [Gammaproteobacteria bacterium]|nr:chemoreceptor glutamine deamidase CheD [Gammaproteobacteria bacterium]
MTLSSDKHRLHKALPEFEGVKRYWDKTNNCVAAKILPGEYYVSVTNELITTVLGSCISVCIRDAKNGVGGMNHFMLPKDNSMGGSIVSDAARYGNYAMEHLINDILHYGGERRNLEFKVFGGGKVLDMKMDIGKKNIDFVFDYLKTERFSILSEDVGDIYPRKVNYFPLSGIAKVKKLKKLHNQTIISRENKYRDEIQHAPVVSDIELF